MIPALPRKVFRLAFGILPLALSVPAWAEDAATAPAASPAAVHIASYKSKATADLGWRVLADHYSGLLYAAPEIREVDLPGKGHFYRLFASGDPDLIKTLCASLKAHKLYCDPHPVVPAAPKPARD